MAGLTGKPRFPRSVIILIVEDEALFRMDACEFLIDQEFTVFTASDAQEALAVLHQLDGKVDLLFTDVNLPGERDGFDLVREVGMRWPGIRILFTSGALDGRDLPADLWQFGPVLSKPYHLDALALKIVDAIFPPEEPINLLAALD